jgi:hypothetical protein
MSSVASGPTSTFGSIGSPTRNAAAASTKRRSKSSAIGSATMNRFAAIHDWPLLIIRAFTAILIASSRSALGITTNGSLPPSSSTVFLIRAPACAATCVPAPSLPVSVTATTRGSSMTRSTSLLPISSVWKTPSGNPARRKTSSIASAHCGTLDACLSRPTLPAIKPGAANRNTCQNGKFHGITASTGPIG